MINLCSRAYYLCLVGVVLCGVVLAAHGDEPAARPTANHTHTNALIDSTSPYLLQHAHNPVNWMPWGTEAFAKAKAENKPVFVSVGYSTCYWCHVMERESFEDEEVARILNEHYIAIKVDREQRPDIDEQLMLATQLMTGRGGWPNSVWLTTDGRPWMAATYFPRDAFIDALTKLSGVWNNEAAAVEQQAAALTTAVRQAAAVRLEETEREPTETTLERALEEYVQLFDSQHGGFGRKPKFPPHGGLRLLAFAATRGEDRSLEMLTRTLDAMWLGGIHDHIGGGFHRYSTDEAWLLPHFEKMLYDNAQLMRAYAEAYEITGEERYRTAVRDIWAWVQREMTAPQGAFYSALDSESEGEEGRFNTWSLAEVSEVLDAKQAQLFQQVYNFEDTGNFAEEATGQRSGQNIPFLSSLPTAGVDAELADMRARLLEIRDRRPRPHLDDKVLTNWNGLMIGGLAYAGRVTESPELVLAAERAADFILSELRDEDGKLLHAWRKGRATLPGYLDDYAFLAEGLLELHTATGDTRRLTQARQLSDAMLELFEDTSGGGFFYTSDQHDELLVRSKNLTGGGNLPVGNGVAVQNLVALSRASGETTYRLAAERSLRAFASVMRKNPRQVEHLILAAAHLDLGKDPEHTQENTTDGSTPENK